jgi:diacylglycerol kinase family enzyme
MMAIVLNSTSGPERRPRLRDEIAGLFRESGIDARIRVLAPPCDIDAAVRASLAEHPEAVIAGGGDGTISGVASVLAGTPTPMGVLPLGTLNHFARDAGIPTDLAKAVQTVVERHARRVDVAFVNDRIFINNASIGVYPSFVESREQFRAQGRSKWASLALATADVWRRDGEVAIRMQDDHTRVVARTPFVFVGNNEYQVEGFKLGARTRLDGGRLYAYYARRVRTRELPKLFARSVFGLALHQHGLESMSGSELWIDTPFMPTVDVACDGEVVALDPPLHYRAWPAALWLLAPGT